MTTEHTNSNFSPPVPEDVLAPDEFEITQCLTDAYDAPPVPDSLLRRIDQGITAEWGQSPGLVDYPSARWKERVVRGARFLRSLPVAAGLALAVLLTVMFNGNSQAYGWAAMLQALADHGIVQADGANGESRWLSLADGILGQRTSESVVLVDTRQQVVLKRSAGGQQIMRRRISSSRGRVSSRPETLVLGFLLGAALPGDGSSDLENARVVSENWEQVSKNGSDQIALFVEFETEQASRFELGITLDCDSQLPLSCEVQTGDVIGIGQPATLAISYPEKTLAELKEFDFPSELSIIDVGDDGELIVSSSAENAETTKPASQTPKEVTPTEDVTLAAVDHKALTKPAPISPEVIPVIEKTLEDDPSEWPAVKPVDVSGGEAVQQINELMDRLWAENGIVPAAPADNEELLRRVYLDLAGRTPSVSEVRAYLSDQAADRYEKLVDRLLNSPDHASHLATVYRTFLLPEGVDLTNFGGVEEFDRWLANRFASNDSYDEVVRSLLLAEGRLSRSGPLLFYSAAKLDADQLASRTARVFLGMRLECAQCHDHPFEPWTQDDFWGFAAFFARISRPRGTLENVSTVMQVRDVDRGEVMMPDTEVAVAPKFLNGAELPADSKETDRRKNLADWLTDSSNPYFARAAVNRVWGQLFGKGVVEPIDDFGIGQPPRSPELLDLLAGHFIGNDFSLREMFRAVALSNPYRLSSGADELSEDRVDWFAQMNVKMLTAEQVYDCIAVATLLDTPQQATPMAFNVSRIGNTSRDAFIQEFKTPAGRNTEYLGGIPQALTLMNGAVIDGATSLSTGGLLKSLEAPFFTNEQRVEVLYLATLSRKPRNSEWALLRQYISEDARGQELTEALADILWALLNSAEFTMNH